MLNIVQIVLGVSIIITIILQAKGGGLGGAFGGGASYHTKRGAEKTLFYLTILLATAFVVVAFLNSIA